MRIEKRRVLSGKATKNELAAIYNAVLSDNLFSEINAGMKESQCDGVACFYLLFLERFNLYQFNLCDAEVLNQKEKDALLRLVRSIYNGEIHIQYLTYGIYHTRLKGSDEIPQWIKDIEFLNEWFKTMQFPYLKKLDALWIICKLTELLLNNERPYQVKVTDLTLDAIQELSC